MKILKTMVGSDNGTIYKIDTIKFRGGLWLVPGWLESPEEKWRQPRHIIRIDHLPHQKLDQSDPGGIPADYVLNGPVPKAVLDGASQGPPERPFVVERLPEIRLRLPPRDLH